MAKIWPKIEVTKQEVNNWIKFFDSDDERKHKESSLRKLFRVKDLLDNSDIDNVLLKANNINSFYSTRILDKDLYKVCEHIGKVKNIHGSIKDGDLNIVNKMAVVGDDSDNVYSFASKYCHFANPEKFSIYDSNVHNMLYAIQKHNETFYIDYMREKKDKTKTTKFTHKSLKDYNVFMDVMDAFLYMYKQELKGFSRIDVDKFLWTAGKFKYFKTEEKDKSNN